MTDSNDPEAVPIVDHRGHSNDLFNFIQNRIKIPGPGRGGTVGSSDRVRLVKKTDIECLVNKTVI